MRRSRGLWVWRVLQAGGVHGIVDTAARTGCSHVIVKSRDGLTPHNQSHLPALAEHLKARGISLKVWAWVYARATAGKNLDSGGRDYVAEQAERLAADAQRYNAVAAVANIEAPFSWGLTHRWSVGHYRAWGLRSAVQAELQQRARIYGRTLRHKLQSRESELCSFPLPGQHALPFADLAADFDVVSPMLYFARSGGYGATMARSIEQWERIAGHKPRRYTGPLFRAQKDTQSVIDSALAHNQDLDWWALDKSSAQTIATLIKSN